jgi:hypothetical protein
MATRLSCKQRIQKALKPRSRLFIFIARLVAFRPRLTSGLALQLSKRLLELELG